NRRSGAQSIPAQRTEPARQARLGVSTRLSISRVLPTCAAIATTTAWSIRGNALSVCASTASTYSIRTPGVRSSTVVAARTSSPGSRAPSAKRSRAAASARLNDSARSCSLGRHVGRFRSRQCVDLTRAHPPALALEVGLIAAVTLVSANRWRVKEQRVGEALAELAPLAHQREMSLVQKAHRWYECDGL